LCLLLVSVRRKEGNIANQTYIILQERERKIEERGKERKRKERQKNAKKRRKSSKERKRKREDYKVR